MKTIKAEEPLEGSSLFVLPPHQRLTPLLDVSHVCVRHTLLERVHDAALLPPLMWALSPRFR